jgi:hypothetical protein
MLLVFNLTIFSWFAYGILVYEQSAFHAMTRSLFECNFAPIPQDKASEVPFYFLKDKNKLGDFFKLKREKIYQEGVFEGHFLTILTHIDFMIRAHSMEYCKISELEHTEQKDLDMSLGALLPRLGPISFQSEGKKNVIQELSYFYLNQVLRKRYINLRRKIYAEPGWIKDKIDSIIGLYNEEIFTAVNIYRRNGLLKDPVANVLLVLAFMMPLTNGKPLPMIEYKLPVFQFGISPIVSILLDQIPDGDNIRKNILLIQKGLAQFTKFALDYDFYHLLIENYLKQAKEKLSERECEIYLSALAFYLQSWNFEYHSFYTSLVANENHDLKRQVEEEAYYMEVLMRINAEKGGDGWWGIKSKYLSFMIIIFDRLPTINDSDRALILAMYQTVIFKKLQLTYDCNP